MKRSILLLLFIISFGMIFAGFDYENRSGNIFIEFDNEDHSIEQVEISKVIALPSSSAEIIVENCEVSSFTKDGEFLRNETIDGTSRVEITNSFVMRELYGHQLELSIKEENRENMNILNRISFQIKPVEEVEIPRTISPAFLPVYRSFVDNYDSSYLRNTAMSQSKMLIIAPPNLVNNLSLFTDWKNARGIATEIVSMDETGTISYQIKTYIQNYYDNAENPADYLLLIGDVDDDFKEFPSFYTGDENDVTDLPFTLLAGDDYFPEMLAGRFSIDSYLDLDTIISKVLFYEKEPFMDETDWFHEALLIAGNYSSSPPVPSTPIKVTKWLRDKMYDYGYTEIDEIYYPPTQDASTQVISAINEGVGFVAYRGWGDANGWHFPEFHAESIYGLSNGKKLPVVTSIVCNTGDFANSVDPCFGEVWLRAGNPGAPKGAVVFTGPSDLHTNTKFNNAIYSGFYYGLLDEGIHTFGTALLRGKTELYNNYPLLRDPGEKVEFYYEVYNILGDPSLMMWTTTPQEITCDLPDEITLGTNFLEIELPGLDGATVTAIKENEIFEVAVVENDLANLYFNSQTTGAVNITITKPNYIPYIHEITVDSAATDIGLLDFQADGSVIAGSDVQLTITLKNFGSETANSISADLVSDNPFTTINSGQVAFGNIVGGETASGDFQISISTECPDNEAVEFTLELTDGTELKFVLVVSGLIFEVSEITITHENNYLEPGTAKYINVYLENIGSFAASGLHANIHSLTEKVIVDTSAVIMGSVNPGATGTCSFLLDVQTDCFIGELVSFRVDLTNISGLMTSNQFSLEIGDIDLRAPTGPDNYGYYAYDINDVYYENCPEYEWFEIDPDEGGSGEVILMGDDVSSTIATPFDFPFYGIVSDSMTICSNGWISFIPTWDTYFRNWTIPSALGPYATICAFWDDLIGPPLQSDPELHEYMRICYEYDQAENIFVIEWNNCVNRFNDSSVEKFEIVLYDPAVYQTEDGSGIIQINYQTISNPDANNNYSTIGIENPDQSSGLLYSYANLYPASASEIQDNFALKFTTEVPVYKDAVVPVADFSADITTGIIPLEVAFSDNTAPLYFFNDLDWNFGDGSSNESGTDPVHSYQTSGLFDVTLNVANTAGSDSITKEGFVSAYPNVEVIWPGDTDYSGTVDETDIDAIASNWRETGFPRTEVSYNWSGYDYPGSWENELASIADCNGDGEVNIADVLGICLNWNNTHTPEFTAAPVPTDFEKYKDNYLNIYNSLGDSEPEQKIKNYIRTKLNLNDENVPNMGRLISNYPNPFNPTTTISFQLNPEISEDTELNIYNIKGQKVKTFQTLQINQSPDHQIIWNGRDENNDPVASGIYFYQLIIGKQIVDSKRMLMLK